MAIFWQPQTAVGACVSEMWRVKHRDKWPINTENLHSRRDSVRGKQPCARIWDSLGANSRGRSCHADGKRSVVLSSVLVYSCHGRRVGNS